MLNRTTNLSKQFLNNFRVGYLHHHKSWQWVNNMIHNQLDFPRQWLLQPATYLAYPTPSNLPDLLAQFSPISLAEMDGVALLNRTDTKYVLTINQLYEALLVLPQHYRLLEINQVRLNHYQTLYFDTPGFDLYLAHHAGRRDRVKVRSRQYVDTHRSFLEIKHKTNKDHTVKHRLPTPGFITHITDDMDAFLHTEMPCMTLNLEPKLGNTFSRLTLVSLHRSERLTLDVQLQFATHEAAITLSGIAIAEVKQTGRNPHSDFIQQMRAMKIQPMGFSKYCMGVSLLYPQVKHNNFKPKLRWLNKLMP